MAQIEDAPASVQPILRALAAWPKCNTRNTEGVSELERAHRCGTEHTFSDLVHLRLRNRRQDAADTGTAIHAALELLARVEWAGEQVEGVEPRPVPGPVQARTLEPVQQTGRGFRARMQQAASQAAEADQNRPELDQIAGTTRPRPQAEAPLHESRIGSDQTYMDRSDGSDQTGSDRSDQTRNLDQTLSDDDIQNFVATSSKITDLSALDAAVGATKAIRAARSVLEKRDWIQVGHEQEFSATIGELDPGGPFAFLDNYTRKAKLDRLAYELSTNTLWITDTKSEKGWYKPPFLTPWPRGLSPYDLHLQVVLYWSIMQVVFKRLGYTGRVAYRIDRVQSVAPHTVAFYRVDLPPPVIETAGRQIRYMMKRRHEIHMQHAAGVPVERNYGACTKRWNPIDRKFQDCDYYDLCRAASDRERDQLLERHYYVLDRPSRETFVELPPAEDSAPESDADLTSEPDLLQEG